jgi:hypothetical protein
MEYRPFANPVVDPYEKVAFHSRSPNLDMPLVFDGIIANYLKLVTTTPPSSPPQPSRVRFVPLLPSLKVL